MSNVLQGNFWRLLAVVSIS